MAVAGDGNADTRSRVKKQGFINPKLEKQQKKNTWKKRPKHWKPKPIEYRYRSGARSKNTASRCFDLS